MIDLPVRPVGAVEGFGVPQLVALLGTRYSDEQIAAITAPLAPYVVVAGAGSGKTTVMTARVVWLVATGQIRPDQVLGLTFTTKAAGELASRVRDAVRRLGDQVAADGPAPGDAVDLGEPVVSTYHAFAGRLLAEHGLRIGVEPQSRLLGEAASYQLAHRVVVRTTRDVASLGSSLSTVVGDVRALDAELAEHCIEPAQLRAHDAEFIAAVDSEQKVSAGARDARAVALSRIELAHLVDDYRAARRALDVVDFADQMRLGARLAQECPEVGAALREQFGVVLLDEYQDTSVAQRQLLTSLFGAHPVTAVGDPLQSIYGWRGASVANIDDFPEHFAPSPGVRAPVLTLAENRRSGVHVLESANRVAQPLRALHPQVAPLVAADPAKPRGEVRVALHETYAQEIDWLADQVVGEIAAGSTPSDIAVLVRVTSDLPALMAALSDRGVAFEVRGVDGLLTVPEVVEVLAVLDVLHDSTANPSLVRILAGPRWRIGPRDLALLGRRARILAGGGSFDDGARDLDGQLDDAVAGSDPADVVSLLDAVDDPGQLPFSAQARERFAALSAEVRALRRHVGDPLPDLVHRVITTTGLDVELAASPEILALRRVEGLHAFVDLVAAFQDAEGESSVGAFLAWLRLAERYDRVPELDRTPSPEAVQLMTVHKAKGLEWPVVVLPSLTDGVFPSTRGRSRWTRAARTVPFDLRGDAASLPQLEGLAPQAFTAFRDACKVADEHEERRLAYVAMTRAERLLIASASWWGPRQKRARGPSAYLDLLRVAAQDGCGTVERWAQAPGQDDANPVLGDVDETSWPAVPDQAALERRRTAARGVLDALGADVDDLRDEHAALSTSSASAVSPLLGLAADDLELVRGWDDDIALLLEERRAEREPTKVVHLPSSMSASDLVRLAQDPDAFTRRLARPMPTRPVPAARRGTRFHAWVEQHYGVQPLLEPDDLPGAADADIDSDDALDALQRSFLAGPYADRTPVAIEVPFSLVVGGRVVPGRIDAVFCEVGPDGITRYEVVDWKTSRDHDSDPLQLAIYRIAWAELHGVPLDTVDAAFHYVRDGSVERPGPLPDRAALESLLGG